MTREEIINGLQMTMDLIQFDSATGDVRPIYTLNDLDKTTYLACKAAIEVLKAQNGTDTNVGSNGDAIYRQDAIDVIMGQPPELHYPSWYAEQIKSLPSAQPEPCGDAVSRQTLQKELALYPIDDVTSEDEAGYNRAINDVQKMVLRLPSAQPERTCVNCGRTANNGGWYADGRTRCPIEEHYALPKDGYCHLWEKRNVTDDNYPESREE